MALAYLDFTAQEIAIAAALSGDERLAEAALTGDPYLAFARAANLVPADATKETHGEIRDRMKAVVLGVGYGMGAKTLAFRLQINESEARHLLQLYDEAYPRFAEWREDHLNRRCSAYGRRRSSAGRSSRRTTPGRTPCAIGRYSRREPKYCAGLAALPWSVASGCAPRSMTRC